MSTNAEPIDIPESLKSELCKSLDKLGTAIDPKHYHSDGIEPIEFITSNNLGFCEGNVIKYVFRHKEKDGLKDLKKAMQYLKFAAKQYYNAEV